MKIKYIVGEVTCKYDVERMFKKLKHEVVFVDFIPDNSERADDRLRSRIKEVWSNDGSIVITDTHTVESYTSMIVLAAAYGEDKIAFYADLTSRHQTFYSYLEDIVDILRDKGVAV